MPFSDPSFYWSLALLTALVYAVASARRDRLDARRMYWATIAALAGGVWGSHLLGTLVHGTGGDPWFWLKPWSGGKSWFGGLALGTFAAWWTLRRAGVSVAAYAESAAPAVALAYAVGRIGCFINGDDYGTLASTPWAVRYGPQTEAYAAHLAHGWIPASAGLSLAVHPVQIYDALAALGLFVLLRRAERHRLPLLAASYGTLRFVIEYWRGDFHAVAGPLSLPQCFSLLLLAGTACLWRVRSPRALPASA